jgi:hypothetical protein
LVGAYVAATAGIKASLKVFQLASFNHDKPWNGETEFTVVDVGRDGEGK